MKLDFRPILIMLNARTNRRDLFLKHTSVKGNADFFFLETGKSEHTIEPAICMLFMSEDSAPIV